MHRSRALPICLLILTVLPVTVFVVPLVLFGAPFWLAGVLDVILGNYGFNEFLNAARQDMVLMFISAPIGLVSLIYLWKFLLLEIKGRLPENRRSYIVVLSLGVLAGVQLLFVKVGIIFFLAPATLYAFYRLTRETENASGYPTA